MWPISLPHWSHSSDSSDSRITQLKSELQDAERRQSEEVVKLAGDEPLHALVSSDFCSCWRNADRRHAICRGEEIGAASQDVQRSSSGQQEPGPSGPACGHQVKCTFESRDEAMKHRDRRKPPAAPRNSADALRAFRAFRCVLRDASAMRP